MEIKMILWVGVSSYRIASYLFNRKLDILAGCVVLRIIHPNITLLNMQLPKKDTWIECSAASGGVKSGTRSALVKENPLTLCWENPSENPWNPCSESPSMNLLILC